MRELADARARDTGDLRRPFGAARRTAVAAEQIRFEPFEPLAVAGQKAGVVQSFDDERVRDAQHQRRVGMRPDRDPFRAGAGGHVRARRTDHDERRALFARPGVPVDVVVDHGAAGVELRVLRRGPAEHHHQSGRFDYVRPGRHEVRDIGPPEDVRHYAECRAEAVIPALVDVAAVQPEEPLEHARPVMEAPGAGPAVGAAVNRFVAVLGLDPRKLVGDEAQRVVPAHGHEGVAAAAVAVARAQVAGAHIGPVDAQLSAHDLRQPADEGRGMAVGIKRGHARDGAVVVGQHVVDTPVRSGLGGSCRHVRLLCRSGTAVGRAADQSCVGNNGSGFIRSRRQCYPRPKAGRAGGTSSVLAICRPGANVLPAFFPHSMETVSFRFECDR